MKLKMKFGALLDSWRRLNEVYGRNHARPWFLVCLVSLGAGLVCLAFLLFSVPKTLFLVNDVSELRVLSQEVSNTASEATTTGRKEAFNALKHSISGFNDHLDNVSTFKSGSDDLQNVIKLWTLIDQNASNIEQAEPKFQMLYNQGRHISEVMPEIQAEYNGVVDRMVRLNAPASQVALAKNQLVLAERILRSINSVLNGDEQNVATANDFSVDVDDFGRYLQGQINGDPELGVVRIPDREIQQALTTISHYYNQEIKPASEKIMKDAPVIYRARLSASRIFADSRNLLPELNSLLYEVRSVVPNSVAGVGLILSVLLSVMCFWRLYQIRSAVDRQKAEEELSFEKEKAQLRSERAHEIEEENRKNQVAILRLLDELSNLADGDLRITATVSEDFTGAIADSINYAIDQLRMLVSAINTASMSVASASHETQKVTMSLAEASEMQAQEIENVSGAINKMAFSIDQVSINATESASVAKRSVDIAQNGADVVQRTIEGMDVIREQIQETSKRLKRLGESSQEIGDIISLINDIADQTNILSLNAAIQASMAGEAGRGFAVVADEVQRLAERSAAATKQIETLVKTIQSDTNEAVISMERTTSEVIRGANLAHDAGEALGEIRSVSRSLSDLIYNISDSASQQATSAIQITKTMSVIQKITSQTTTGSMTVAGAIGELATMATELRHSVAGFKLPDGKNS